jgi:hypothetical protein
MIAKLVHVTPLSHCRNRTGHVDRTGERVDSGTVDHIVTGAISQVDQSHRGVSAGSPTLR